ncbi:transcriptional repressor [Rhodovulum sulfidophilum]|nr:Fur family transcriptional regulator [Rhodovulum visakhapatnamense]OLS45227.1 transcriptional repressor [Rhodovulum sulfidophilum]
MQDRSDRLTRALRAAGIRITRQRGALMDVLAEAEDHPDAAELHRRAEPRAPGLSLPTVYRTLSALEDQGVIQRHQFEGAPACFQRAETAHHDHMIDIGTGEAVEFRSDRIEEPQARIAAKPGYDIVHHRMELYVRKTRG